jgi:hypothetical protein
MIAITADNPSPRTDWQVGFLELLPEIQGRLRQAFRQRDAEAREEAIADGTALCLLAFRQLQKRGGTEHITASNLTWFAAKQIRSGRSASCRLNSNEPLAIYAQQRRGIRAQRLHGSTLEDRLWIDALVQDRRSSVLDQVAAKLDVAASFKTLRQRTRRIAADLATGCTTSEVAKKHGVTASRISQLRQELAVSWSEFQHEPALTIRESQLAPLI